MATFGENLKALRQSRGYSQDRFAKAIGSNQVNVSAWELGTRTPHLATIRNIADTFKVPITSLVSVEDDGGLADDFANEVADAIRSNPKLSMIFNRIRFMEPADIDAVCSVVNALTKGRDND